MSFTDVMSLGTIEVVGAWISIFLTICIFSYLYGDNPVYKLTEHIFVGVSIGVAVVQTYYGVIDPLLVRRLMMLPALEGWLALVPLALIIMLFMKLSRTLHHFAYVPIAYLVAAFAAIKLTGEAQGNLLTQIAASIPNLEAVYAEHGLWDWSAAGAGVFSSVLLVVGLASCLYYFYFSSPQTGALRYVTRFAVLILMVAFGAAFGMTVMGRITLAFGRATELLGLVHDAETAARIHAPAATLVSAAIVTAVIVAHRKLAPPPPPTEDDDGDVAAASA